MSDRIPRSYLCVSLGICLLALLPQWRLSAQSDTLERSPATPRAPLSPLDEDFPYGGYKHSLEFDSTDNNVVIRESEFGLPYGVPQSLSLDEYLAQRREAERRRMWEKRATAYELKTQDENLDELEKILGRGTEITLPIPQNPLMGLFGPPTVSINVNGSVNVSAGWQWDNNNLTSISSLGSTQSAPFFNQDIQVAVSGRVGNLLKLSADFQTQRQFDLDNQLKIAFGGGPESDDAIIQGVEAGNVQLQTPSTLIGGSQTLFGVKSSFKFGPLFLTAIASQKRGERKTITVKGGSVTNAICLKPYDYAQNHFFLDTVYKRFYDEYFESTPPAARPEMADYGIVDIEVYEQVKDASVPSQFPAIAYADLPATGPGGRYGAPLRQIPPNASSGEVQRGNFRKLNEGTDFTIDRQLGTLTIRLLQIDKAYAVAYRTKQAAYGEFSNTRPDSSTTAVLKLVYVANMQPGFRSLWARQMKNIYPLQGARNIDLDNTSIRITYGVPPSDTSSVLKINGGVRLVEALGVDRVNSSNQPQPDGQFDVHSSYLLDAQQGEIIFPSTEPFRKQLRKTLGADAEPYVVDAIYDETRDEAQQDTRASKYFICGNIAGTGGNKISLGAFYLAPNSISVTSNGEPLQEGVDYRVDPVYGEITLLSPKANSATGNLEISYEQNDFATIANKNLLGLRADYDLLEQRYVKSKLGMTFMRYGQSMPTDKVQIYNGDESVTNVMLGFDGWIDYQANFLTKALDALPLLDTKAPSSLSLRGEWAMVMPDPNTKPSLVNSDGNLGAAYIDDFESGAKRQIQLGVSYTSWYPASPPHDDRIGATDSERVENKGHTWWYNHEPANTTTSDIWPNKSTATGNSKTSVLDLVFDPKQRGMYNMNPQFETAPTDRTAVWGGMMRSLSFYAANLNEENIDYIEITMAVDQADPDAKMFVEIGQVSEDVIPNYKLDTEDGITPNNPQMDDVLNQGEDVGIDAKNDDQERAAFPALSGESDPARDDYSFSAYGSDNPDDYTRVNGLEGNVGQERAPIPDSEDLNGNRGVDLDNSYFQYEVDLDPDPQRNSQIVGKGGYNWRQYRIPIRTGYKTVGNPSFTNVQYVRVWFKSGAAGGRTHVRLAEFNLVGSDWRDLNKPVDSTVDKNLDIAFVNLEDNAQAPDFYTLPPGLQREIDQATDVYKNEQSLAVRVNDLPRGEERAAARIRPQAFDLFNYKQMKFFLHGSGDMDIEQLQGQPPKVVAFMRFGFDSLNYYEYRVPLLRGWNGYEINFADLAAIKQARNGQNTAGVSVYPVPGEPDKQFAVRGQPSLTSVQFIAFGIENNAYPGDLNTTMWVDELRAVGAEDANDWAATMQAGLKLADVGTINYNASRYNPNFHRLEERFGNRSQTTDWAVNSVFQLEKFLPAPLKQSTIPFTYNHIERIEHPLYLEGSDVAVSAAVDQVLNSNLPADEARHQADSVQHASELLRVSDAFAFSNFKLVFPGESWLVKKIANGFTFGYDYSQERLRSTKVEQSFNWRWDFRGQYSVAIPPNFDVEPFGGILDKVPVLDFWKDFKIHLLPTSFTASMNVHRDRAIEKLRELENPEPVVRNFYAGRNVNFSWKMTEGGIVNLTTDYTLDAKSSLVHLETDEFGHQRLASDITSDLFFNEGRVFNFGYDTHSQQDIRFNTRPRIPFIPDIDRFVTPTARYSVTYSWNDNLTQSLNTSSFTKSAQWNSTATLGLDVRLHDIANLIWGDARPRGRTEDEGDTGDGALATILRYLIKIPLLDYDHVNFTFNQNNSSVNPGVRGGNGLANFWGRSLLFRSESPDFGPGMAYQLGLTNDPHGRLHFGLSSGFPFVSVNEEPGLRAPNIYVQDNYSQKNTLTASTSRALWPGASLNLNWQVDWGYNDNVPITTDANGEVTRGIRTLTGNLSRTYLSVPSIFGIDPFGNNIEGVVAEYARRKATLVEPTPPPTGATQAEIDAYDQARGLYNRQLADVLSKTFENQLEAFNWLPGDIGSYLPRVNWTFVWNGLENLPFLSGFAQSVSIRHAYTSRFTRNHRETDQGDVPETQTVSRGFSPLLQVNVTGKPDVFNGTTSAALTYNTTTDFALVTASPEISQDLTSEIQLQLSYQRRGMKLPIFGLDLKNDLEFSLLFGYSRKNTKRFNLVDFKPAGNNDGSTTINLRPSIRYSLSQAVTASAFVSYEATIPDAEGSRDIRRSTTKVGIDIRLGISGGR